MNNHNQVSMREIDHNGFVTVDRNPISREGVFPYMGSNLPGADPDKIYQVYRPAEELTHPEALKSFRLIPLIDDHVMLGEGFNTAAEEKGVHGTTGEDVVFENGILYAPLKIFSDTLKRLIEQGKKALSIGYRCVFEKSSGVFQGQAYDYIQRGIRGNHIALVHEGRSGPDIAVLDHQMACDSFDLNLNRETKMADEAEKTETKAEGEYTIAEITALLKKILPQVEALTAALKPAAAAAEADAGAETSAEGELDADKKALDADDKEEKGDDKESAKDENPEEKKAMDNLDNRIKSLEKRDTKAILADISARDAIVKEVSGAVGVFDHSLMTADEVAVYACDKLDLKAPKGQERAALNGYLAGLKKSGAAANSELGFALDTKANPDGLFSKTMAEASA